MYVPDDFEATMVISGPANSLKPMALGGEFSEEGGRREGKREWRDTAGLLVSRVTCKQCLYGLNQYYIHITEQSGVFMA